MTMRAQAHAEVKDAETIEGRDEWGPKIRDWLTKLMESDEVEGTLYILLVHERGGTETLLDDESFPIGYGEATIEETTEDILDAACDHAESHRGLSKYILKIKDRKKPIFRFKLIARSEIETADLSVYDEEDATAKGHLSQMMRHDEVKTGIFVQGVQMVTATQKDIIEDLRAQLASERAENQAMRKEREDFRSMQFQRDMEIEKFRAEEKRHERLMEALTAGAGMLIQAWAANQGDKATVAGIREVFVNMTPEQQAAFMGALTEEQRAKFSEVHAVLSGAAPPAAGGLLGMIGGMMGGGAPGAPGT